MPDCVKVLVSDLLWEYRRNNPHISWGELGVKANISGRTIERYAKRECRPKRSKITKLLSSISVPDKQIRDILQKYYNVKTLSARYPIAGRVEDRETAATVATNIDKLVIWGLGSRADGTTIEQINQCLPGLKSQVIVNEMLNSGAIREINNRLKANDITFGDPKSQTEMSLSVCKLADDLFDYANTKALNMIWGWNSKGVALIEEEIDTFSKKIQQRSEQEELRGNIPLFLGLSLTDIGQGE